MKSFRFITAYLFASILLMGCPYSSSVPIDEPSIKIDNDLLGQWKTDTDSDSKCKYNLLKENEFTYKIEEFGDSGKIHITFGHVSSINGITYFNIQDTANKSNPYCFYKYEKAIDGSKIMLIPVTENIRETFTKSKDLKKFFRKNQSKSFFFEKDTTELFKCR